MSAIAKIHGGYVHTRRVRVLSRHIASLLPENASVLDVGCGDGLLAQAVLEARPDVSIRGIDVLARPDARIPVEAFDGYTIPHADGSFDAVLLVDVLHHTADPMVLLRESARVARRAIILKDHFLEGIFAGPTLRFMDWVGNARHGVAMPYNYWTRRRWMEAFGELGLEVEQLREKLGLYPLPPKWVFERSLHFVATLRVREASSVTRTPPHPNPLPRSTGGEGNGRGGTGGPPVVLAPSPLYSGERAGVRGSPTAWEQAYLRFETPEQEIRKFRFRLLKLGAANWPRDARIIELFCGRGNGLHALQSLGFTNLEGIDLSPRLAAEYHGPGAIHVGDCRHISLPAAAYDIAIVQGGLHHLPDVAADLPLTFTEVRRILRKDGRFIAVEPWLTPFLRIVHAVARNRVARRLWPKLDAMQTMVENERDSYERWLAHPEAILSLLREHFDEELCRTRWGKLLFRGRPRP